MKFTSTSIEFGERGSDNCSATGVGDVLSNLPLVKQDLHPAEKLISSFTKPPRAKGDALILYGQVLDMNGNPIPDAVVEIWQTDANGIYDHPDAPDTEKRDMTFQSFGTAKVNADGWYVFRTVVPLEYGSFFNRRPRHIHFKVKQNNNTLLTSQFYFNDDIAEVQGERMFQLVGEKGNLLLLQLVAGDEALLANGRIVINTGGASGSLPSTPSQQEGPFYPVVPVQHYDNDLTTDPEPLESGTTLPKPAKEVIKPAKQHIQENLTGHNPYQQVKDGVAMDSVACKKGLELIMRSNGAPACVKPSTAKALIERDLAFYLNSNVAKLPANEEFPVETDSRTFVIVSEESKASYIVGEEFLGGSLEQLGISPGPVTAVGTTQQIEGQMQLNSDDLTDAQALGPNNFTVNIESLTSDDERRDDRIKEHNLESSKYPLAKFTATAMQGLPAEYARGQKISFQLLGDLTVREITVPAVFDVTATIIDDSITGKMSTNLQMTDFGFDPPDWAGIRTVENDFIIEIEFKMIESKSGKV